jgi:predicted translin family RNA/ssDNA-binding protein
VKNNNYDQVIKKPQLSTKITVYKGLIGKTLEALYKPLIKFQYIQNLSPIVKLYHDSMQNLFQLLEESISDSKPPVLLQGKNKQK